jgi:hypothetical protein
MAASTLGRTRLSGGSQQSRAQKVLRHTDPVNGLTDASAVAARSARLCAHLRCFPCPVASIGKAVDQPFRFNEEGNPFVSGPKGAATPR